MFVLGVVCIVIINKVLILFRLAEMILDKKFDGTLDQENNCLILFETLKCDVDIFIIVNNFHVIIILFKSFGLNLKREKRKTKWKLK